MHRMPSLGTLTRRTLLTGAIGAAGALAFWPSGRERAKAPRGRIELRYWEKWTGIEGIALQRVVDRYNASHERAWVRLVPVSDIGSKAMVAIGGGDPPDVVGLYSYHVPGYAEARAVLPLDEFTHMCNIDESAYLPGVRALLRHEGRPWAGVNTCYTLALYANRAHLREVDHDPDAPPRDVAELDDLARRLTLRGSTAGGRIERAGFLQNVPGWWNYFWPCMFGGTLFDEAQQRITIAAPENVACFSWLRDSAQRLGVSATTAFASGYGRNIHTAQDPFLSGHQSMIVQGPWLANFIRALRPDLDYTAFPVPAAAGTGDPREPTGLLEADVLMIPRGSPHPEEAYRFIAFMQRQDVQEELALAHAKPSPLLAVSPEFQRNHPNRAIRAFEAVARSPRVMILPRTSAWKAYADLINTAFDRVWAGADPAKELNAVQTRAQQMVDTAAARRAQRGGAA